MDIKIIRSDKRTKTVSAKKVGTTIEILAPAQITDAQLEPIIEQLVARINRKTQPKVADDTELATIAARLNTRYFNNTLAWKSLTWSAQQEKRYGSCTPALQTIRISQRIASMPLFVKEYVVMHELAHLVEANHGARFWRLVNKYPRTERARGYLMAVGLEELNGEKDEVP